MGFHSCLREVILGGLKVARTCGGRSVVARENKTKDGYDSRGGIQGAHQGCHECEWSGGARKPCTQVKNMWCNGYII